MEKEDELAPTAVKPLPVIVAEETVAVAVPVFGIVTLCVD